VPPGEVQELSYRAELENPWRWKQEAGFPTAFERTTNGGDQCDRRVGMAISPPKPPWKESSA